MPIPSQPLADIRITAKERVYQTLREWIINGTLQPGEKILDQEIAKYFSVSRTPVREAIQQLADQKLIDIYPGRESLVAPIDLDVVRQCYQMMAELQALAVEFAFPKINPKMLWELAQINQEINNSGKSIDHQAIPAWDQKFHDYFFDLAGNDFLFNFCRVLYAHILRVEILHYSKFRNILASQDEHTAIINALKEGDLKSAKEAMRENWLFTMRALS